ncbi:hypothetical protein LCGC14_2462420 [marine sediment metagenome]|uniref:Uncharacterized protein n=1 Tax=marine sediment metagenome TaxID=412755 RepID=A0A0F9E6W1_9ZZZZ
MPRNLGKIMMICPFCECDAWHIGNVWVKCFLCQRMFSRNILDVGPIAVINRQLKKIKKIAENPEAFGGFFESEYDL